MKEPQYSSKMWIHTDGRIVNIPYGHSPIPEDHTAYAAQNPHLFDHTEKELANAIGGHDELHKAKNRSTHHGLQKHLESKGWTRVINSVDKFDDGTVQRTINFDRNHVRAHPDDYVEALKTIKPYVDAQRSNGEEVLIGLHGFHVLPEELERWLTDRDLPHRPGQEMIPISNEKIHNAVIGETGGKVSRTPPREQSVPTSTEVHAAAGEKPKDMPVFMWKRMFNFGDSYQPRLMSFKKFLDEGKK